MSLRCPVILAAGACGTLDEMADVLDLSRVGAIVTKSITKAPREGNPPWRILPARAGMLNAVGLANVGVEAFIRDYEPRVAGVPTAVIASVAGFSIDDYAGVAGTLSGVPGLAGIEINVSCPNVHGGAEFSSDVAALKELVRAVRAAAGQLPLLVKLSPIANGPLRLADVARAACEPGGPQTGGPQGRPGADALTISNTIPAMSIDVETRQPRLANVTGGLSGAPLHAVSLKLVHDVYRGFAREAGVPIIGAGGVHRWEDAAEFILAGASAVQMATALFADPRAPLGVARGLERWVRRQGASNIGELVGAVRVSPAGKGTP